MVISIDIEKTMCSIDLFVLTPFHSVEQHCRQGRVEVGDETFRKVIGVFASEEQGESITSNSDQHAIEQ